MNTIKTNTIKIVAVGDGAVGKTCLLQTYTTNSFSEEYSPTVFDNYSAFNMVDGLVYNLCIWDTAGQEDYDKLRPLSYSGTDIYLVCYSITNKTSFENIRKWKNELEYHSPKVPMILVGLKNDLRSNNSVNEEVAKTYASENGFRGHYLCSSKTQDNIKKLFDDSVRIVVEKNKQKQKISKCIIL